ncbi:MAG TPA: M36 family metallopeptidase [Thermoleophilaceae bacterium]
MQTPREHGTRRHQHGRFLAALAVVLGVIAAVAPAGAGAFRRTASPQADPARPFFDIRGGGAAPAGASPQLRPARVSSTTKNARQRFVQTFGVNTALDTDPVTGTVRSLQRLNGTLTGPSAAAPRDIGWNYIRSHTAVLGLDTGDLSDFQLAENSSTPDGLTSLRWTQDYKGIPAFDNDLRANVDPRGRLVNVLGTPLHNLSLDSVTPSLSALDALHALMRNVGVTRSASVTSGPAGVRHQTTFSTGNFARLVVFGGYGTPRLAWHVTYTAGSVENYDAVVDADTGQVLYRQNLTKFAANASVWSNFPGATSGGTAGTVDLDAATTESPSGYLPAAAATLNGPNAHAFSDVNDDDLVESGEETSNSTTTNFNYPQTSFNGSATDGHCSASAICSWDGDLLGSGAFQNPTSWETNMNQNAVQAFWFVNNFHDHLATAPIGFVSPGNFQDDDKVMVNADDGANINGDDTGPDGNHLDNANFTTNPVGMSPKMQMYLFNFIDMAAPFRDINGGDDAAIVYHENTHGLSNRLITNDDGTGAVSSPEAGAMGEAWSDWYAEDFLVRQGDETDNPAIPGEINLGEYTDATPNQIRTQPMDCPVGAGAAACPGGKSGHTGGYTYGDFGKVIGSPEVHADGEIWGETLWDLRTQLITFAGGEAAGSDLAEKLITDGMRLSPPEPSYLDERNAILGAVQSDSILSSSDKTAVTGIVWTVFAHRGMGFFAGAADGSDVSPVEDFNGPSAAGGPTGTISGTVTSADTGLPIAGLTVGIGGHAKDPNASNVFVSTTGASGNYSIPNVPIGTYGKLVAFTAAGFDSAQATGVPVTSGGDTGRNFAIRRDWASSSGGATIVHTSDDTGADFGCGADGLIDQSQGVGWSAFNPTSTNPGNPGHGSPTVTIELPQTINVRAFLADPSETCGDDSPSQTKGFTIATSPDNVNFTPAVSGNFTPGQDHQLNVLTPTGGATNVRFVKLTLLSPQSTSGTGADFIDFTELEVLGGPPNVLPSGSLTATPSTVPKGGTVHFDASSFHDPDSLITGYSWDFDGNGTADATTPGPTVDHAYTAAGTLHPRVTANDFVGGGGSASATVVVTSKPNVTIARKGKHGKLTITVKCSAACRVTASATVSRSVRKRLHLKSATVAKLTGRLKKAGTKHFTLKIAKRARTAAKRHHTKTLAVTVHVTAKDSHKKTTRATRHAKVKL